MKKRYFIALALIFTVFFAQAQTEKGYYLIGGNIGNIKGNFQKGGSSFGIGITPKVAWFVKDNIAVGGQIDLNFQTAKGAGSTTKYTIGPLARFYFRDKEVGQFVRHTTFFVESNVGIGGSVVSKGGGSTNGLDIGLGPGLAFFVNENIALETLLKYNLTLGFGSVPVSSGVNFGVGFQIYLPTAKN